MHGYDCVCYLSDDCKINVSPLNSFGSIFTSDHLLYPLFQVCNEVVCLDLKPAYGSICWIPDWRMDVFKRCCRQIQKGSFFALVVGFQLLLKSKHCGNCASIFYSLYLNATVSVRLFFRSTISFFGGHRLGCWNFY